ncbi:MAG: hypothetical protein ACFFCS_11075 [Candidatus Hodarchaeota archaeon]
MSEKYKKQVEAGTTGRKKGHKFEEILCEKINEFEIQELPPNKIEKNVVKGNPVEILLQYIIQTEPLNVKEIKEVKASWLGGLATSGKGDIVKDDAGKEIKKSKSDVLLDFHYHNGKIQKFGISVKSCNNKKPTNDQMFFTTATAFCKLLNDNGFNVSEKGKEALRRFCGDTNYRPDDLLTDEQKAIRKKNKLDLERWFWEELPFEGREELEKIIRENQNEITNLLLRKAYPEDPYPPEYLIHQTVKYEDINNVKVAIFTIYELVQFSYHFNKFCKKDYTVKGNSHQAPRFGFIQFQRKGSKKNATQLQFNLKAGYFYKLPNMTIEDKKPPT